MVDFDKINELMAQRRAAAREAVSKAEAPAAPEGSPKHGDEAFRDLFGNEEKPPWEKSLAEIREEEKAQKRQSRTKKAKDKTEPGKSEKGPGTRTGRPSKVDKAARDKPPAPGVLDKVSRGGKKDKDKENDVFPIIKPVVEKMASIVKRFLSGYDVDCVYVVGGASCFDEFEQTFEKALGITTVKTNDALLVTPLGIAWNAAADCA